MKLLGWAVRHLMVLRENLFGSFTQYTITREYLAKLASAAPPGDPLEMKYRIGKVGDHGYEYINTFVRLLRSG